MTGEGRYKVLLVDDDQVLANYHAAVLEESGLDVRVVYHPDQALAALDDEDPDLVVVDYHLPGITGPELTRRIREMPRGKSISVLLVTADEHKSAMAEAFRMGVNSFLTKPLDQELFPALARSLATTAHALKESLRLVEEKSRRLDLHFQAVNAHAIVSMTDAAGRITYCNEKFVQISGYSQAELLGNTHRVLKSGAHGESFYQSMWQTITQGRIWRGEVCNRKKNGKLYWVSSTIVPSLSANGQISGYISIRTDITGLKHAELALRESLTYQRGLVESSLDGIVGVDEDGSLVEFNPAAEKIFGYQREGIIHAAMDILLPADVAQTLREEFQKAMQLGKSALIGQRLELSARHSDGHLFPIEISITHEYLAGRHLFMATVRDISERKRSENALRESEQRFRRLFEDTPIAYQSLDSEGRYLDLNPELCKLLGYREDEMLGQVFSDFMPAEMQPSFRGEFESYKRAGMAQREINLVRKNGQVITVLINGRIQHDAQGQFMRTHCILMDITERKENEKIIQATSTRLAESNRMLNTILETIPSRIFWKDTQGRFLGCNTLFAQDAGHASAAEIIGTTDYDQPWQANAADYLRDDQDIIASGKSKLFYEEQLTSPSGDILWLKTSKVPLRDLEGKIMGVLGVYDDITKQKADEVRLEQSEQSLRHMLEISPIAVRIMRKHEARLSFVNKSYLDLFHTTLDDALRTDPAVWYRDRQTYRDLNDQLERGEAITNKLVELIARDGKLLWALASYSHLDYEGEEAVLGWFYDVTELTEAQQTAERANRAKSEFLSSMSHELRTPLNAILGFSQLMELDSSLTQDQLENVEAISKAGRHLLELINEVLDLAKVESGRLELSLELVELSRLVTESIELVEPLARRRNIELRFEPHPAWIHADRTRFKQAILNLLSNAIKYNVSFGRVDICLKNMPDGRIRMLVRDTGPGIPEHRLVELFQPFNRLGAEASGIEGTGIGLTITQRIVEMMGGEVGVESTLGAGSTFWIEMPLDTGSSVAGSSMSFESEERRPAALSLTHPSRTLLYIEDNPLNIKLVGQILTRSPQVSLHTASTPEMGIELAMRLHPDLVLLDINLPGMDGYQILSVFRDHPDLSDIPVIAVTAQAMPHDIEKGLGAGFVDYITKPLDIQKFQRAINRWLHVDSEATTDRVHQASSVSTGKES